MTKRAKIFFVVFTIILLSSSAYAFPWKGGSSAIIASYVGPIATSTSISTASLTSSASMTRKAHLFHGSSTRMQLLYANWWVDDVDNNWLGAERGSGNSITVKSWIEYPSGTYTAVTFSSSSSVTIADGANAISDFMTVSIPDKATFYTWTYAVPSGGTSLPFLATALTNNVLCPSCGEANCSTPTTPGTITDCHSGGQGYYPTAILGDTTSPSFCLLGDSRVQGYHDVADTSHDLGDLARSIGPSYAYMNMGVPSDRMTSFFSSGTKRTALTSYCTNIVDEYAANDLAQTAGITTVIETYAQVIAARFNGKKYARTTKEPETTSTDNWATVINQTQNSSSPKFTTFNDWVRTLDSNVPYAEIANQVTSSNDSGIWNANGTAQYYTYDGIHLSQSGALYLAGTGAVSGSALASNSTVSTSYPSATMTASGTTSFGTGKFSQAMTGGGGYVYGFSPGNPPETIECWAKNSSASGTLMSVCGNGSIRLIAQATTCYAGIGNGTGTNTYSTTSLCDGSWHHVAGTADNTGLYTLYVDGTSVATNTTTIFSSTWLPALSVSALYDGAYHPGAVAWPGAIDELALWNYVRYTGTFTPPSSPYVGTESGLMGLWHFNGDLTGIRGPAGL